MNRLLAARTLLRWTGNRFSTSGRALEGKVKTSQIKFQDPDGVPTHLKGGTKDYITYSLAMGLTAVGTLWTCFSLVKMSVKK